MASRTPADPIWGDPSLRSAIARSEVKAGVVATRRRVIEERYGSRGLDAVLAALSDAPRALLREPPLVTTWVSTEQLALIDEALIHTHLGGDPSRMRSVAEDAARFELNAIYTFLLKLGGPEFVLKRIGAVFGSKARPGVLREDRVGAKQAWLELTGMAFPYYYVAHVMPAWAMGAITMAGAKDPRVELLECEHLGDRRTYWRVDWR
jgi:hypothetical protein